MRALLHAVAVFAALGPCGANVVDESCGAGERESGEGISLLQAYRGIRHTSEDIDTAQHLTARLEASASLQANLLQEKQTPTETTHKSWFARLGDAVWSVLIGLFVMIPFSTALLWVNERRTAQLETLLGVGQAEAETIEATETDLSGYDGTLVHLDSEMVRGLEPVQDARFPAVKMAAGCIKLKSTVEVYQWQETEKSETKKDNVGGGTTTKKTYSYSKGWCLSKVDSARFHEGHHHRNTCKVDSLQPGSEQVVSGLVKYGEPYRLEKEMVGQLQNFEDAKQLVGETLAFGSSFSTYTFARRDDGHYYYPAGLGSPDVGDMRVKVDYVLDGPASILALQLQDKQGNRTFGPYRAVPRPICGGTSDEELKHHRLAAAKKEADEIYRENKCWDFGPFYCLCGCCNLVTMMFSAVTPPQIMSVYSGKKSKAECFDSERAWAGAKKWGFRLLAWLLLWIGFTMLFEPLPVILDIIPFLGPWLGSGLSYVISLFTFLLTMALASFVVSLAYLVYRPAIGVLYLVLTAGIFYGIYMLGQHGGAPVPVPAP